MEHVVAVREVHEGVDSEGSSSTEGRVPVMAYATYDVGATVTRGGCHCTVIARTPAAAVTSVGGRSTGIAAPHVTTTRTRPGAAPRTRAGA